MKCSQPFLSGLCDDFATGEAIVFSKFLESLNKIGHNFSIFKLLITVPWLGLLPFAHLVKSECILAKVFSLTCWERIFNKPSEKEEEELIKYQKYHSCFCVFYANFPTFKSKFWRLLYELINKASILLNSIWTELVLHTYI